MDDDRNQQMLDASQGFEQTDAQMPTGTSLTVQAPTGAVFGEPIVPAQPLQPNQRRNIERFLQRMKVMAQMAGETYRYQFPVKTKGGGTKTIEGGTIDLANDLVREYGNCMIDPRVVETPSHYIFYVRFIDYETGFCLTRAFRQRKGQQTINTDKERAEDIVFQIGQSKAIRNVILNALGTYADFAYDEAKNSLITKIGKDLPGWRTKITDRAKERGYDMARIEKAVGKPITDWLAPDIARVVAELKSILDGMASFDDLYPVQGTSASDLNKEFVDGKTGEITNTPPAADPKTTGKKGADKKEKEPTAAEALAATMAAQPASKLTPDQQATEDLFIKLKAMKPEERGAAFVEANGLELVEKSGRNPTVDKMFKEIGIMLPTA